MDIFLFISRRAYRSQQEEISALVAFRLFIGDASRCVKRLMDVADQMLEPRDRNRLFRRPLLPLDSSLINSMIFSSARPPSPGKRNQLDLAILFRPCSIRVVPVRVMHTSYIAFRNFGHE